MSQFSAILDELASLAVVAEPTDLNALATIHTQFEALVKQVGEVPAPASAGVTDACGRARQLVEAIVLRETKDAQQSLDGVRATISEIQAILNGGTAGSTEVSAPAVAETAPTVATGPVDALQESPIKADDAAIVGEFISESGGHCETAEAERR